MNLFLFPTPAVSVFRGTALHRKKCPTPQMMSQFFNLRFEESDLKKYCELKFLKCLWVCEGIYNLLSTS